MMDDARTLRLLTEVLDELPTTAPDRLLGSVLDDVQAVPQRGRRPSIRHWRNTHPGARRSKLVPVGLILGVVAVVALLQIVPRTGVGPAASASPSAAAVATAPAWTATGSMVTPREGHTATLLQDGRVLVAGGLVVDTGLASAELYDPRTGSWTATGSLIQGRAWHTATLLQNGTVLVTGGLSTASTTPGADIELASAELYDPRTGSWTAAGSMTEARSGPSVALLPDGRVLVTGGWASTEPFGPKLASSELFDPATGTWTATGSMTDRRHGHSATLLPNGTVLVAGGYDSGRSASAELYDPITGTWTYTGSLPEPFLGHSDILLLNGTVLIAGGDVPSGPGAIGSAHAAVYDPDIGTWTATGSMNTARLAHAGTLLPDGRVLVSGGRFNGGRQSATYASVELYDPATRTWTAIADMTAARSGHTATMLPDGHLLVVGGVSDSAGHPLASAELLASTGGS